MLSSVGTESHDPNDYDPMAYNDQFYPAHLTQEDIMDWCIDLQNRKAHPFELFTKIPVFAKNFLLNSSWFSEKMCSKLCEPKMRQAVINYKKTMLLRPSIIDGLQL